METNVFWGSLADKWCQTFRGGCFCSQRWYLGTKLHGITLQKTFSAVRILLLQCLSHTTYGIDDLRTVVPFMAEEILASSLQNPDRVWGTPRVPAVSVASTYNWPITSTYSGVHKCVGLHLYSHHYFALHDPSLTTRNKWRLPHWYQFLYCVDDSRCFVSVWSDENIVTI
jgi:hypothetical protein